MSLISKPTELTEKVRKGKETNKRGNELSLAFSMQYNAINEVDYFPVKEVEQLMLDQKQFEVNKMGQRPNYPRDIPKFSPSSSDKCERELFYKNVKAKQDETTMYPFNRRWTRNSTAVHEATQRQLLESEIILPNPDFKVNRLENGLPAWEKNIEGYKVFTHNGVQFVLFGMCDGILDYKDGSKIGFEYKTKSNSVAQIKQIKEPQFSHKMQTVAYSLLFGVDEWLITYESVAKDKWSTGENARPDFKVFYVKTTEEEKQYLLDKFARVTMNLQDGEVSHPDFNKCLFCPFKTVCNGVVGRD